MQGVIIWLVIQSFILEQEAFFSNNKVSCHGKVKIRRVLCSKKIIITPCCRNFCFKVVQRINSQRLRLEKKPFKEGGYFARRLTRAGFFK